MRKILQYAYLAFIYLFLYVPIVVLVVFSFNDTKFSTNWQGFTWSWYAKLFTDGPLMEAFANSLIIAVSSSTIATILGTLGAFAIYRYRFLGRKVTFSFIYVSMMSPDIVMGISLLMFFILVGLSIGATTLLLAHITFCLPFVVVTVFARISGFDRHIIDVAKDLGASELKMFRHVIMPMLMPAIIAGWLLSFTLSMDDVVVSFFTTGPSFEVLPLKIYSMVRIGIKPEINALSAVMFLVSLVTVTIAHILIAKENR
ncbi:MAG TPA: spermidine/putrescine ABC transporter permease PotC [Deltaproteobacteria bacterium]|nr:spermidine/putrescine ABC transporter permease PotC [Deltaproteobacteria bacterium]HOI08194.1 spermidine/putrescine ABC transporter permease PotC [Deltaproteobacteria bacterium]